MSAIITISFYVPPDALPGDYAKLHGNNGSGDIDWDVPLADSPIDLFPNGAGIYGFGYSSFGNTPFGKPAPVDVLGWGNVPFGKGRWGYGAAKITVTVTVHACGDYKFGFSHYDKAGNKHAGSPEEITVPIHVAPPAPTGLRRNSYDKDTDILVLDAL